MKIPILILILSLVSCGKSFKWPAFKKCIESAPSIMDYPIQVESLGKSYHAIRGYQMRNEESYIWSTSAYFGGRYEIFFTIDVMLNYDHTKVIKILSEPRFHLLIVEKLQRSKIGVVGASYEADIKFGKDEWKEMMKVKGDIGKILAVLDIKEVKPPLPLFDEFRKACQPIEKKYQIRISKDKP
jgi:hypothetical protein